MNLHSCYSNKHTLDYQKDISLTILSCYSWGDVSQYPISCCEMLVWLDSRWWCIDMQSSGRRVWAMFKLENVKNTFSKNHIYITKLNCWKFSLARV